MEKRCHDNYARAPPLNFWQLHYSHHPKIQEVINMEKTDKQEIEIILRDIYPSHPQDEDVEQTVAVSEDIYKEVKAANNYDESLRRANRRNGVVSLDVDDGTETAASIEAAASVINSNDPAAILEMARMFGHLHCALNSLPEIQRRRMVEHYLKCKSQVEIAKAEGVSVAAVNDSIKKGRKGMREKFTAYETGKEFCDVKITIRDNFDWKQYQ